MIKGKENFLFGDDDESKTYLFVDERNELTVEYFADYMRQVFGETGLPVNITIDDYQESKGAFKKTEYPCVVITSMDTENDFARYVIVIANTRENGTVRTLATLNGKDGSRKIYEQMQKTEKKYNKAERRAERNFERSRNSNEVLDRDLVKGTGRRIANSIRYKKVEKLADKYQDVVQIERNYYTRLISTVNNAFDSLGGSYQCLEKATMKI